MITIRCETGDDVPLISILWLVPLSQDLISIERYSVVMSFKEPIFQVLN